VTLAWAIVMSTSLLARVVIRVASSADGLSMDGISRFAMMGPWAWPFKVIPRAWGFRSGGLDHDLQNGKVLALPSW